MHMISKSMIIGQLHIQPTLIRLSYIECSRTYRVMVMVFNVTFYNMSVISWKQVTDKVVLSTPRH